MGYLEPAGRVRLLHLALVRRIGLRSGSLALALDGNPIATVAKPDEGFLARQLVFVRTYADLRPDRIPEILEQTGDILSFFGGGALLNAGHRRRTRELMIAAQQAVISVCAELKHRAFSPRPIDFDPRVCPVIQTPDHSTYPSGHSMEAFALATVLHRLMTGGAPDPEAALFRIAHRIAVNRTVAGVHFPVDSAAGAVAGCMIGEAMHALATGAPARAATFRPGLSETDTRDFGPWEDFTPSWLQSALVRSAAADAPAPDPVWAQAWRAAEGEWRRVASGDEPDEAGAATVTNGTGTDATGTDGTPA